MTTMEIGKTLVELCQQGKNFEAIDTLYADDVVSVEAGAPPGMSAETVGKAGVLAKGQWWIDNHEVHSGETTGPWPHGDQFIVGHRYDVTFKQSGQRFVMEEMALYTVADGKIVREAFFYAT
jgi:ketosteroid isomerase-like protein